MSRDAGVMTRTSKDVPRSQSPISSIRGRVKLRLAIHAPQIPADDLIRLVSVIASSLRHVDSFFGLHEFDKVFETPAGV